MFNRHNRVNQRWNVRYVDETPEEKIDYGIPDGKPFYIVSRMPFKRVVDMQGSNVIIARSRARYNNKNVRQNHQLWQLNHKGGEIRNMKTTNRCFVVSSSGKGKDL
jgi:hypothetical protein